MTGNKGFTYISAMILVVITGIALTQAGKCWRTVMKRENEKELLFRGRQIRNGIESYYNAKGNGSGQYPLSLKDILRDPRFPVVRKYVRKIYKDPMAANEKWGLVLDKNGHVKGVFSKSVKAPLKKAGFPDDEKKFENAKKYSDWKFVYSPTDQEKS